MFELAALPTAIVEGSSERFPVGRIFCVGRNYEAHAQEMGGNPHRDAPFFFTKFPQALVPGGGTIPYPPKSANYHYEGELVIAIGLAGAAVSVEAAPRLVWGYAVGLDMTRRDLQTAAREKGYPWDTSKNFAFSAPLGPIRPVTKGHVAKGIIELTVNGVSKQRGDIADMIWNPNEIIAQLSALEKLLPGDLIYTGTPAGVGALKVGDVLHVTIEGLQPLDVTIAQPA